MANNLQIDDRLLTKAKKIGGFRTKRAAVTSALNEFVQRREQVEILRLGGTIDYDKDYDYKKARARK